MITIDISEKPDSDWNKRLENSPLGTIYQTKEYALLIKSQLKSKPIYLKFFDNKGSILGQLLLFQTFRGKKIIQNSDKHSVQKNIERAKQRGVRVSEVKNTQDLVTYYELLNEFRHANNLTLYSYEDVVEGFQFVKNIGQMGFLAWYNEIPIGGIFISSFNKYINEWGIARTLLDSEKKLYSLDLLRWEIIEWGIKNNMNYYDLSGVEIKNRSAKEDGIFRNKRKWGGSLIEYSSFTNF